MKGKGLDCAIWELSSEPGYRYPGERSGSIYIASSVRAVGDSCAVYSQEMPIGNTRERVRAATRCLQTKSASFCDWDLPGVGEGKSSGSMDD